MSKVKSVLIVGGGTAGWLTAAYLSRVLASTQPGGVKITLVESPEIGIIGVGEATFPTIRSTLSIIGIDEGRFMRATSAAFKQGVMFTNWVRPPGTPGADHYFHPFSLPSYRGEAPELLPYWLMGAAGSGTALADAVTMQSRVVKAFRAPKRTSDGDFQGPFNYAYHFDATRLAKLCCEFSTETLGVERILANVVSVERDERGAIAGVTTRECGVLTADLYVDCSGFRGLLIGEALGSRVTNLSHVLFNDRAVAMQVPYARPDAPIPPYTISAAQESGWIWDIGLRERQGIGYIYSSAHTSQERAEAVLRAYIGPQADALGSRHLKFTAGFREIQWSKNCVAVGLAGGFLEPLESSSIALIELAAYLIAHLFPHNGEMEAPARFFNKMMAERYLRIVDFLKLHYCLTKRADHAYWRDNADARTIPDALAEKFAMWRGRPPHRLDFVADHEMFQLSNWQYCLYGMEFETDVEPLRAAHPRVEDARREFDMIRMVAERAVADLPDHRELVERINGAAPMRRASGL